MARRDRTTGLPRPRPRRDTRAQSKFAFAEQHQSLLLWVAGGLLLVVLVGLLGYRWYDNNFLRPDKTILAVNEEKFSLRYYSDRLFLAASQASGTQANFSILQQALLTDLEDEAIGTILARERGITVTDEDITAEIASQLGVAVGGAGSSFDTLYRQRLRSVNMSDGAYRRYIEAVVYLNKLRDSYASEIGDKGELVTLRAVVSPTKEAADAVAARIKGGEDLGTVAQNESNDVTSRQKDGLMEPEPVRLLPEAIRTAIEGKSEGSEVLGPVEVTPGNFWVFRIQARQPQGDLSETQKGQLADLQLEDALAEKRGQVDIDRNMSSDDFQWANDHADD